MANYTTNTSDKKKCTALLFWAIGGLGLFGFEYYYVVKIKAGIIKSVIGIIVVLSFVAMRGTEAQIPISIIFWLVISLPNLFKILVGTFKDNVGQPLRN